MAEIRVPKLNTNDSAYVLLEWLVADGAPVRGDDVVASVETSKTVEELVSGHDGILVHLVPAGADCTPGQPIARITSHPAPVAAGSGEALPSTAPLITAPAQALIDELGIDPARVRALPVKVVRRADVERLAATGAPPPAPPATQGLALSAEAAVPETPPSPLPTALSPAVTPPGETPPAVVPPAAVAPSIVPAPATSAAVASPGAAPDSGVPAGESVQRLSGNQRAVGRTVSLSHRTIPAAYTAIKVDVGKATAAARDLTKRLRKLVGLPDLLIAAVARLHQDFPLCFATLLDEDTAAVPDAPDVGVTIDLGTGLYVPVIRDAHDKGIEEIAGELAGFRRLAQRGGFRQEHLDGGNIVVTLHHDRDIVMAVPIVFPGQACALALTSPQREGERTVAVIGLAYDHRLVNGRDAVLFLQALKEGLEAASFEGL
ncbi:2-oxo acid dehydrogenase subunit E2 [Nonomuraea angiospora]|uniref:Dihydrolipoamide acetyltransferase component of pyruvate dehydrogenase complex n=1 Tax=Nonomuraea angiospora TaxID=46172 RepID=A0ABR9MMT2_9ACTN|nr:2-oxo acid dehydrogenase subunit E2 [Nonomuraea angiospora]MBE1593803.1 2-oxoglutarate dehydrogenase E2 component (dihydrolipoamide succinyltransferase) [Nonomuraea angiospora]